MKKIILLTVALVMTAVGANAQNFSKGDFFLNANASELDLIHTHRSTDSLNVIRFNIAVGAGYFISNKFAVDASLGLGYSKVENDTGRSSFTFGAGARYYPVGNLFARVGYDGLLRKDDDLFSSLSVAVGYDWFLSEKVFFEPSVYYRKNFDAETSDLGLSLGVGVKF